MAKLPTPKTWASYLRWLVGTFIFVVAVVGFVNAFIDPLNVLPSPRVTGLNAVKPYLDHHRELTRYVNARRICADTGIFGNSRAEIGFDPVGRALTAHGMSAFNHAVPGTSSNTSYQQLLWLRAANCFPKTIFLGVDFFDFIGGSVQRPLPTIETSPAPRIDWRFLAEAVVSNAGLKDSVNTVLLQNSAYPTILTERGFNPLLNYVQEVKQSGHYTLFRQRAEENLRGWARRPLRLRPLSGDLSDDEATIEAIISSSAQAGSKTYLIIYPYHALIRAMIERLGMGALFSEWKRTLFTIAKRSAGDSQAVEVWDFSGISSPTLEAIPAKGDLQTRLQYYWEAGHFKKELGELVVVRVLDRQGTFGVMLDDSNLASWLTEDRRQVQNLLKERSSLTVEVDDIFTRGGLGKRYPADLSAIKPDY